jgi:hypothetical protein
VWSFHYESAASSVVIISRVFDPALFCDFLGSVRDFYQDFANVGDAISRFTMIESMLQSWIPVDANTYQIYFPLRDFRHDITAVEAGVARFSLAPILPKIEQIWSALLANDGILIIALTPEIASYAALSCLSLLGPLQYCDNHLFFTQSDDPRTQNLRPYRLIGTTDPTLARLPFGVILNITETVFGPCPGLRDKFNKRTMRYYGLLLGVMDLGLLDDPYFDLLQRPIDWDRWKISKDFDRRLLRELQKTNTFQNWRMKQVLRQTIRTGFLSTVPNEAVARLAPEEYEECLKCVRMLQSTFAGDRHLMSVLKVHAAKLTRKLREMK